MITKIIRENNDTFIIHLGEGKSQHVAVGHIVGGVLHTNLNPKLHAVAKCAIEVMIQENACVAV